MVETQIVGTLLYGAKGKEFFVGDFTDLPRPRMRGRIDVGEPIISFQVYGTHALLCCGASGVVVVDATNPDLLRVVARVPTQGTAVRIKAWGDAPGGPVAYVANTANIVALRITNPALPTIVARFTTAGPTRDIELFGVLGVAMYVWVAAGTGGAQVVDVSNPAAMFQYKRHRGSGSVDALGRLQLTMYFVSTANESYRVTVNDPEMVFTTDPFTPPFPVRRIISPPTQAGPYLFGTRMGDYARLGMSATGALVSNPPEFGYSAITGSGQYFASAILDSGVRINRGTSVGLLRVDGVTTRVRTNGDRVYIGDGSGGLQAFTVNAAGALSRLGGFGGLDVKAFDVFGQRVFALGQTNAKILDFSTPAAPTETADVTSVISGSPTTPLIPDDVVVSGTRAYVTAQAPVVSALDVANAASPVRLNVSQNVSLFGAAYRTPALVGTNIIAANGGIAALAVRNNSSIGYLSGVGAAGGAGGLRVQGTRAFLADGVEGLKIFDISDAARMTQIGACDTPGNARAVDVYAGYAFVADHTEGVAVVDISDDTNPRIVGTIPTTARSLDVRVDERGIFVANGSGGLAVWQPVKAAQTVTIGAIADVMEYDDAFEVSAEASSGLPVEMNVEGPARLSGRMVTPSGTGLVTLRARQPGSLFLLSASAERTFMSLSASEALARMMRASQPNLPDASILPEADTDRDGVSNIAEYLMNGNPLDPASAPKLGVRISRKGGFWVEIVSPLLRSNRLTPLYQTAPPTGPGAWAWSAGFVPEWTRDGYIATLTGVEMEESPPAYIYRLVIVPVR